MRILEIIADEILDEKQIWGRKGNQVVRKYRCTSGRRKGRIVSNPAQCFKAIDVKKRMTLKRTKAKMGTRMARRAQRTKRINPASRRLKNLNRRRK
tara:strand:- start:233 stop:520 length:288 start_codon:yes stop_codon:yes gene_type:complete